MGSEDANDTVNKQYGSIAGLMAQLPFAKSKLMVYKMLQVPGTV